MSETPKTERADLDAVQQIADLMSKAAAEFTESRPEIAAALSTGSETIEGLCDLVRAQERLIAEMLEAAAE